MNQLEAIRCALTVRKSGSFSAAANKLFMAQPNLSRMICRLEKELGILLFVRKSTGVVTTPEGERFLTEAKVLLEKYDSLLESCRSDQKKPVAIAAQPLLVYKNYLADIAEHHAGTVYFRSCGFPALLQLVAEGTVDFSFVCIPEYVDPRFREVLQKQGLEYRQMLKSDTYLCCRAKTSHLSAGEVAAMDVLDRFHLYYYIDWRGMGLEEKTPIPFPYRTADELQIIKLAESDPDFAMLTVHPYEDWYASLGLEIHRLADCPWGYHYGYVQRADEKLTPLCNDILQEMFQAIRDMTVRYAKKNPVLQVNSVGKPEPEKSQ